MRRLDLIDQLEKKIETVYGQKCAAFELVEDFFSDHHGIPKRITSRTIKRKIFREINLDEKQLGCRIKKCFTQFHFHISDVLIAF